MKEKRSWLIKPHERDRTIYVQGTERMYTVARSQVEASGDIFGDYDHYFGRFTVAQSPTSASTHYAWLKFWKALASSLA
jgi:hypothetical protein